MTEEQDYCVEENDHRCEGCIYCIIGERKDKRGYIVKTSACLCEDEMAASCAPEYQFPPYYLYKGKMNFKKGKIYFHHNGRLKNNVVYSALNNPHDTKGET